MTTLPLYQKGQRVVIEIIRWQHGGSRLVEQVGTIQRLQHHEREPWFPRGGWWYRVRYKSPNGKPLTISRHEMNIKAEGNNKMELKDCPNPECGPSEGSKIEIACWTHGWVCECDTCGMRGPNEETPEQAGASWNKLLRAIPQEKGIDVHVTLDPRASPETVKALGIAIACAIKEAQKISQEKKEAAVPARDPWTLQNMGYAPGEYFCKCYNCKKKFKGDKRAVTCEQCAEELLKAKVQAQS